MNTASTPANFDCLNRRIHLTGTIKAKTGLRIGAGKSADADLSDLPVLRDAGGYPYLPGSSIKGVVRSTIEGILRGLPGPRHSILWSCDPLQELNDNGKEHACGAHKPECRPDAVRDIPKSCAACRLFGTRVLSSHVRFADALQQREQHDRPPVQRRDGVAIDRDLLVMHGRLKYDYDVVSTGTIFGLEIFADNLEYWELGLLMLGLDQLADGFVALGGFGSRGLGRVTLDLRTCVETNAADLLSGVAPTATDLSAEAGKLLRGKWAADLKNIYSVRPGAKTNV